MLITVNVPRAVAIKNKLNDCGGKDIHIMDWEGWTDEERDMLARLEEPIDVEAFTLEALLAVVRAAIAAEQQKQQEAEADKQRRAELLAALPDLARRRIASEGYGWITHSGSNTKVNPDGEYRGSYYPRELDEVLYAYVPNGDEAARVMSARGDTSWSDSCDDCHVPDDLAAEIKPALDKLNAEARAEAEREYLAAQAKRAADAEAKRVAEEAVEAKRQAKEKEADELFLALATEEQKARHAAGYMPKQERDEVARLCAFLPFGGLPGYRKITEKDFEHTDECCRDVSAAWGEDAADELTAEQFGVLVLIKAAASAVADERPTWTVTVEPRKRTGTCPACECVAQRVGILVTVTTEQGNKYSRRFAAEQE